MLQSSIGKFKIYIRLKPRVLRIMDKELPGQRSIRIPSPSNRQHEEDGHSRVNLLPKVELRHGDWGVAKVIRSTRGGRYSNQNMLLGTERAGIQVEAILGPANLPRGQDLGEPHADIVRGDLDEEDGIRSICGSEVGHLRQESTGGDEEQREEKVAERDSGLRWIVCEVDYSSHKGGDVGNSRMVF